MTRRSPQQPGRIVPGFTPDAEARLRVLLGRWHATYSLEWGWWWMPTSKAIAAGLLTHKTATYWGARKAAPAGMMRLDVRARSSDRATYAWGFDPRVHPKVLEAK